MSAGKRLLIFSSKDPRARALTSWAEDWDCLICVARSIHEFRAKVEGGKYDMVLTEDSAGIRRLIGEADPKGDVLQASLREIERRHIERVLCAAGGNRTHAAKILGIDTKTLYNRLKSYAAADETARRRRFRRRAAKKTG